MIPVVQGLYIEGTKPLVYETAEAHETTVDREVLISVETDEQRLTRKINAVFPDEPRMVKVAWCESNLRPHVWGKQDYMDCGLFQLSQRYHGDTMDSLGLDCMDEDDNIEYARHLYDQRGLLDWSASAKCWMQ